MHRCCAVLEEWVQTQILAALEPEALAVSVQVLSQVEQRHQESQVQWTLRLEQADYEAQVAAMERASLSVGSTSCGTLCV